MLQFKKSHLSVITDYAPIAMVLALLNASLKLKLTKKFDIAYLLCKQGLAFTKMSLLCALEEHHGVDFTSGYKTTKCALSWLIT